MVQRERIEVTGQVQGVGFRPAVYRLASHLGLTGTVYNDTQGVVIELQGNGQEIDKFLDDMKLEPWRPPLAEIRSVRRTPVEAIDGELGFTIVKSDPAGTARSQVTADIATCADCLAELADERDFRYRYPFINCTNCGPRYSIVKTIPYDRPNTTMSVFPMCPRCAEQYGHVGDRRFHAQPVACPACGPRIWLTNPQGQVLGRGTENVIAETVKLLRAGRIVAIKGIGGFHLAVDALNDEAVLRLRERKRRDHKPFAMMSDTVKKIRRFAIVDGAAERILSSPRAPIVLLPKRDDTAIAPAVAEGVSTFGFMLAYAPLHYLLFFEGLDVLVMTSANLSDAPLICRNEAALERLGEVADAFLMHDREIYRQVDDSIVHFVGDEPVPLRRARGYVPMPVFLDAPAQQDILATGADLKNTFCLAKGRQLILSEHIGDLEDAEVYRHYIDSIDHLRKLFDVEPKVVVCDLHPGYLSTHYARMQPDVRVIQVQHHWAHIASVLAEHELTGPVIGLECDGTGYGTDGAIWGCECMIASLTRFERFGHLDYYPLVGADKASKEAIRPLLSLLQQAYGEAFALNDFDWLLKRTETEGGRARLFLEQIERGLNAVETSSLGRVFDAVAALVGLGYSNDFDAQLPMALQSVVDERIDDYLPFDLIDDGKTPVRISLRRTMQELTAGVKRGAAASESATKFHNTLVEALTALALTARERTRLETVALSGGVFCNRYLTNRLVKRLNEASFAVLYNRNVPANDGGIALGQAAIAVSILNDDA